MVGEETVEGLRIVLHWYNGIVFKLWWCENLGTDFVAE